MYAFISCADCAFQQFVSDHNALEDLKGRHEAKTGHRVEIET